MFIFNLKIALRNIYRYKIFSAINILGLSLGIACFMMITMYVWNEKTMDTFHRKGERIYRLTEKQNQSGTIYDIAVTPGPLAPVLKKELPQIEDAVRMGKWSGLIRTSTSAFEEQNLLYTENSLFNLLDFTMLKGNPNAALKNPRDIVITESTAIRYFGEGWASDPDLFKQTLKLNDTYDFTLAGVVKNPPLSSSIQFDLLLPMEQLFATDEWSNKWNSNNYHTYLLLKPETDLPAFAKLLENRLRLYSKDTTTTLHLQPLADQYLYSEFAFGTDWGPRGNNGYVKILSGVGILLLIIAAFNFVNLSTARASRRSMETGVRKVNGASRVQLISNYLMESVAMAFISAALAIVLIKLAIPFISPLTGQSFFAGFSHPVFWISLSALVIILGCLAGLYPAWVLSGFSPIRAIGGGTVVKGKKPFLRGLVVLQFAVSIGLIMCTIVMFKQLKYMQQKDLGFIKDGIVTVRLKGDLRKNSQAFKNDLSRQPGIESIAAATMNLVNVDNSGNMEWEGMKPDDEFLVTQTNIDEDFINVLGMQLLKGVNVSASGRSGDTSMEYLVNQAAVERMGYTLETAIGKKVNFWGMPGTITGVVKNFHYKTLAAGIEPFIFRCQPDQFFFNLFVKIEGNKTATALESIKQSYRRFNPDTPCDISFLDEAIQQVYASDKRIADLVLLFGLLTVVVGSMGLFGLTVFATEQRIKEIGIRKVLGAGVSQITLLLSKDFIQLVAWSLLLAIPLAWYATTQWLQQYVFRIQPQWWLYASGGIAVMLLAIATISFQAIRAAKANPIESLRNE